MHPSLLLLLAATPSVALAGKAPDWAGYAPFEAPAQELLDALDEVEVDEDDPSVVVLLEEDVHRFDEQGREESTLHRIYWVRKESAVEGWGQTQVRWAPWYQAKPELRARVISAAGDEVWLDDTQVTDAAVSQLDPTMFTDARVLRAPLPGIEVGVVVEEQIVVTDEAPFLAGGGADRRLLTRFAPTEVLRVVVEAPTSLPLRHRVQRSDVQVRKRKSKGRHGIEVELLRPEAPEHVEAFLPYDEVPLPTLWYSTTADWAELGLAYQAQVDESVGVEGLDALVEEVKASDDKLATAFRIARDRVRYTGVEFGQNAIQPYPAPRTIERGYGDCKDKATLMVSLLAEVGIEAHVALLESGRGPEPTADLPGLGWFDHAIVYVPGDEPIWADPTADFTPWGELPWPDQGRQALVIDGADSHLERIPFSPAAANTYREHRTVRLPLEGLPALVEVTTATGWASTSLRADYRDARDEDIQEYLEGFALEHWNAEELVSWEVSDAAALQEPFELTLSVEDAAVGYASGEEAALWFDPASLLAHTPELLLVEPEDEEDDHLLGRETPVVFMGHRTAVSYDVHLPPGYAVGDLPEDVHLEAGPMTVDETWTREGDLIQLRWALDTGDARFTVEEALEARDGLREFFEEMPRVLHIDHTGTQHVEAGRIADALSHYDALIAASPAEAVYWSWRSKALLAAHLGGPAEAAALEAVRLDPESPRAWASLGFVRTRDALGRELHPPFDRDGAIEAYTKASELNPDEVSYQQNLAVLYEYGDDGRHYAPGADLEAAVATYRAIKEQTESTDRDAALMRDLLALERFDEVEELGDETPKTLETDALRLAAIVARDGSGTGLRTMGRWGLDAKVRQAVLSEASQVLIRIRRYQDAADLWLEAAPLAQNPVALRQHAANLQGIRHWEEVLEDLDGPEHTVATLHQRVALEPDGDLDEFFSASLEEAEEDPAEVWRGSAPGGGEALPPDAILDVFLGTLTFEADGSDRSGWRVVGVEPSGQRQSPIFLVKERGRYRVRAAGSQPWELGAEALTRLERGDRKGARQWLGWAHELLPASAGSSPWQGAAFTKLWVDDADDDRAKLLALALAATGRDDWLDELAALGTGLDDPQEQYQLHRIVQAAAMEAERWELALSSAEHMREIDDTYPWPSVTVMLALNELERDEAAIEVARDLHERHPDMAHLLAEQYRMAGQLGLAEEVWNDRIARGKATPTEYNQYAWALLFVDGRGEQALELATKANTIAEQLEEAHLHTLATAQLAQGRPWEALEVLHIHVNAVHRADELGDHWYYVLGGLLEACAMPEEAREAYLKVEVEDDSVATWHLAEARLRALGWEG